MRTTLGRGLTLAAVAASAACASGSRRAFTLAGTDLVDWTLSTNMLQVLRAESP